ncbi:MAG: AAA family ATPase [Alphaproteobacteria bacterium]|nr:AAA family ATPase [Rickettsiales bacterium]
MSKDAESKNIKTIDDQLYSVDSERFLLGSLINDNNLIEHTDKLHKNHFYEKINGTIFEAINKIIKNTSLIADVKTIVKEIKGLQKTNIDGLDEYLVNLEKLFTMSSVSTLVNIIYLLHAKRHMTALGKEMVETFTNLPPSQLKETLGDVAQKIDEVRDLVDGKQQSITKISTHIESILKKTDIARKSSKAISGISTGLTELDEIVGGLKKSDLVILAARPSMGKTALAVSMAYNMARMNQSVKTEEKGNILFFSLEMSGEQIAMRLASICTRKNSIIFETGRETEKNVNDKFNKGKPISDSNFADIIEALSDMSDLPILIDSSPTLKISTLIRKAKKVSRIHKIDAIFVDYLQLVKGEFNNANNRVQEVSEVTQGLKALAKQLNVPVVALAQLSRAVESRESNNFKPQLSDLRESGSIEQDADVVMFLYRESYYKERNAPENPDNYLKPENSDKYSQKKEDYEDFMEKLEPIKNLANIIVSKNRNGPIGTASCYFDRNILTFSNLIKNYPRQ